MFWRRMVLTMAAALVAATPLARAQDAAADFYRGKVMKIVVGFPVGGGFDVYGRVVAEHLPRFIPGSPKMIVENMPGAATARAAAHLYRIAPQDGTVMGLFHMALLTDQAMATKPGEFDLTKFNWIGRMATRLNVGVVATKTGVRTIADARKIPVVMGATAPTAISAMAPRAVNHATGALFKPILGYQGSADTVLAMERGEIGGFATAAWKDFSRDRAEWLRSGQVAVLFQISARGSPELPDVPALPDLASNPSDRRMLELLARTEDMGRAFPVGPGVPPERVAILREAFARMMTDTAFLRDAARLDFELDYMPGETVQSVIAGVDTLTPEERAKFRSILIP